MNEAIIYRRVPIDVNYFSPAEAGCAMPAVGG